MHDDSLDVHSILAYRHMCTCKVACVLSMQADSRKDVATSWPPTNISRGLNVTYTVGM